MTNFFLLFLSIVKKYPIGVFASILGIIVLLSLLTLDFPKFKFPWGKTEVEKTQELKDKVYNKVDMNNKNVDSLQQVIDSVKYSQDSLKTKRDTLNVKRQYIKKELDDAEGNIIKLDSLASLVF